MLFFLRGNSYVKEFYVLLSFFSLSEMFFCSGEEDSILNYLVLSEISKLYVYVKIRVNNVFLFRK